MGSYGVLRTLISSNLLLFRSKIQQMTVHFAQKLFPLRKLDLQPLIIYDHALIWWLFLDLRTGEILTFRSLKMNKFLKAFNANLKRVRRESFIKIKSGKKNIIQQLKLNINLGRYSRRVRVKLKNDNFRISNFFYFLSLPKI